MTSRCGGSRCRNRPRTGAPFTSRANRPPGFGSSRAYSPIHRTTASGCVKYSYTRSGGASMWTVVVTGSAAIAGLHGLLEATEAVWPEFGEEIAQPCQPFRAHHVKTPLALRADGHQSRVPEHLQMLGHSLLGDIELLGDLVDRAWLVAQQPQDTPPMRL